MTNCFDGKPRTVSPSSITQEAFQHPNTMLQDTDARVVAKEQLQQHDLSNAVDYVEDLDGAKGRKGVVSVVPTCVRETRQKLM